MNKVGKVYFFGTDDGKQIKIGYTSGSLEKRRREILTGQLSKVDLYLLAAVNGSRTCEQTLHDYFSALKLDVNSTESFSAGAELVEYVDWLRQQWWCMLEINEHSDETPTWPEWKPASDRRVRNDVEIIPDGELFPRNVAYSGSLATTAWRRLSTPVPKIGEDFYTPNDLVEAAKTGMGGIDLDAASHWRANKVHKINKYYHLQRSAFDNPWEGRVWLNPPYGNNSPWFETIVKEWDADRLSQLCMISPMWAFTTAQARPVVQRASAMIVLSPTPKFWGNPDGRTGTNHPHAILYLGDRASKIRKAFAEFGIPVQLFPQDDLAIAPA